MLNDLKKRNKFTSNQIHCIFGDPDESTTIIEDEVNASVKLLRNFKDFNPYIKEDIKNIFYTKSFAHIRAVSIQYYNETGQSVNKLFAEKLFSSRYMLNNIVYYSMNPVKYFIDNLNKATRCLLGDQYVIISILIMRCELDMVVLKDVFKERTGKSMRTAIKRVSHGFYKYALYELIGETRSDKI